MLLPNRGVGQGSDLPLGPSAVRATCELHMTQNMQHKGASKALVTH